MLKELFNFINLFNIMSISTKFLLITTFLTTLVHLIFTDNLIYTGTPKTLVLIDDWNHLNTHSMFWDQLRGNIIFLKNYYLSHKLRPRI